MTNESGAFSKGHTTPDHNHPSSDSTAKTPMTNSAEPGSTGGNFGLQDHPGGDKSYALLRCLLPTPAEDFFHLCRN